MRIIEDLDLESSDSLSEYLMNLKKAINDETIAISIYDKILKSSKTPVKSKEIIQEIIDDEKDHLVILTELLRDEIQEEFPEYGDDDLLSDNSGIEITGGDDKT